MNLIQVLIESFYDLRRRGVKDPIYCRLTVEDRGKTVGWLWRDPNLAQRDITCGEVFGLSLQSGKRREEVVFMWTPLFHLIFLDGSETARQWARWFFHQKPKVNGGSYQTIDNFHAGAADWQLPTDDFHMVCCGRYTKETSCGNKVHAWRKPSTEALGYASDTTRFLVSDAVRERVLQAMRTPLPSGERLTIHRIFHKENN